VPVTDIKIHHNDLIVSTQGRAFWIMDNISSLRELSSQISSSQPHLFKPRDGYRTRTAPANLGPQIDYYLPAANSPVTIEIVDAKGTVVNSYSSETATPERPGRGDAAQSDDPDAPSARRFGPPPPRVTKNAGLNRVVWDLRNRDGVTLPPGQYQARVKFSTNTETETFNVLIDPRVAADGVTVADLQEQYEHNVRMRALVNSVNRLVARVREAQNATTSANGDGDTPARLKAIAAKLLSEPVRYGKPGLQAHINYLASMTANVDQRIGRDAVERYGVLKKEFDAVTAEVDQLLGPARQ